MDFLREVARSLYEFLQFTGEVSKVEEKPVACLDTQVWYGEPSTKGEKWFKGGETKDMDASGD